jgi:hypothetical protein
LHRKLPRDRKLYLTCIFSLLQFDERQKEFYLEILKLWQFPCKSKNMLLHHQKLPERHCSIIRQFREQYARVGRAAAVPVIEKLARGFEVNDVVARIDAGERRARVDGAELAGCERGAEACEHVIVKHDAVDGGQPRDSVLVGAGT